MPLQRGHRWVACLMRTARRRLLDDVLDVSCVDSGGNTQKGFKPEHSPHCAQAQRCSIRHSRQLFKLTITLSTGDTKVSESAFP